MNTMLKTPPFWGGVEEYGADRETLPLPKPKFRAPAIGAGAIPQYAPMEEDAPPPLAAPVEAPKPLAEPSAPKWSTSDEIRETLKSQPKLERASGWKGVLQAIGDRYVEPSIMHPKYAQESRDYSQKMGQLTALKKLEDQDAENERRRAVAEAQIGADKTRESLYNRQIKRMDEPDVPKRQPLMNVGNGKVFDPNTQKYIVDPDYVQPDKKETPTEARIRRASEADEQGLKGRDRQEYILTGRMSRVASGGRGASGEKTFKSIQDKKIARLDALERETRRRIDAIKREKDPTLGTPLSAEEVDARSKDAWAEHEQRKQQIQNEYEDAIGMAGGEATHFEYPAPATKPGVVQPPPPPPPPAAPASAAPAPGPAPNEVRYKGGVPYKFNGKEWVAQQ